MSSARKRGGRFGVARPNHLVLLPGGLVRDDAKSNDPDWDSFCRRIGWQPSDPALPDDYEDRLLERLLAEPDRQDVVTTERGRTSRIESLVGNSLVDADWVLDCPPVVRSRGFMSTTAAMAFAAVVGILAAGIAARWVPSSVTTEARPDPARQEPANVASPPYVPAPIDSTQPQREALPDPSAQPNDQHPDRDRDETPTRKARAPNDPGARVANAKLDHGRASVRSRARKQGSEVSASSSPIPERARDPREVRPANADDVYDGPAAMDHSLAAFPNVGSRRAAARSTPRSAHSVSEVGMNVSSRPPVLDLGRSKARSWSISNESERWYGLGTPPARDTRERGADVAVVGQLDLAKAITGR
ncbi:MAG: hypothetical protein HOW73_50825 [Polyangiaceae bacterium]|nr:hypothetical protein [Polyangiaceae bacterium]